MSIITTDSQKDLQNKLEQLKFTKEQTKDKIKSNLQQYLQEKMEIAEDAFVKSLDIQAMPKVLTIVLSAKDYVKSLKNLNQVSKELEKATREVKTSANDEERGLLEHVQTACNCYLSGSKHLSKITDPIPLEIQGTNLEKLAEQLKDKIKNSVEILKETCLGVLRESLEACNWPPNLTSISEPLADPSFWHVLVSESSDLFPRVETAAICVTLLQQAVDGRHFSNKIPWFVQAISDPLLDKLKKHFASERQTTDMTKPDWLFETALKIIQQHSPGIQYFQGVLSYCGLEESDIMLEVEFMRSMQVNIGQVLKEYHLPKLAEIGPGGLWITWTEATKKFDDSILDLAIRSCAIDEDFLEEFKKSSCLMAFLENENWEECWWKSESDDFISQVDDIMLKPDAWSSVSLLDNELDEMKIGENKNEELIASKQETWPTVFSQGLWNVFLTIIKKSEMLPEKQGNIWLQSVGRPYWMDIGRRMETKSDNIYSQNQILEANWLEQLCGVICACWYFENNLKEWDNIDMITRISPEQLSTYFTHEIRHFGISRKQRCMKITKEIIKQFDQDIIEYKNNRNDFLISYNDAFINKENGINIQKHSNSLNDALIKLNDILTFLSKNLDYISFREVWKNVALGITRLIFNDIITESKFSHYGAYQLQYDIYTLINIFSYYTHKPQVHFKELEEASTLLVMPYDNMKYIYDGINTNSRDPQLQRYLEECGITQLTIEQIITILDERYEY